MIDVEDETNPVITPLQDQRICTRQSPCNEKECPICDIPGSETHHIQDLTEAWVTHPAPKFPNLGPPAPLNHIIHKLVDGFHEAIDSNDISGIKLVLNRLIITGTTCTNFQKYNHTELTSLKITAEKILASTIQPSPTPIAQQPQQHH